VQLAGQHHAVSLQHVLAALAQRHLQDTG
jgi:hypothetical protein